MAEQIHHIKRIKFAIALDVARADKICLVNVIKTECFSEI